MDIRDLLLQRKTRAEWAPKLFMKGSELLKFTDESLLDFFAMTSIIARAQQDQGAAIRQAVNYMMSLSWLPFFITTFQPVCNDHFSNKTNKKDCRRFYISLIQLGWIEHHCVCLSGRFVQVWMQQSYNQKWGKKTKKNNPKTTHRHLVEKGGFGPPPNKHWCSLFCV